MSDVLLCNEVAGAADPLALGAPKRGVVVDAEEPNKDEIGFWLRSGYKVLAGVAPPTAGVDDTGAGADVAEDEVDGADVEGAEKLKRPAAGFEAEAESAAAVVEENENGLLSPKLNFGADSTAGVSLVAVEVLALFEPNRGCEGFSASDLGWGTELEPAKVNGFETAGLSVVAFLPNVKDGFGSTTG